MRASYNAHTPHTFTREETRIKRALELAHKLRTRTLYGDREQEH